MMDKRGDSTRTHDAEEPVKYKDEDKPSRILRVITVIIYLSSVSMVALLLSLYYVFLWNPHREYTSRQEGSEDLHQNLSSFETT